MKIKKIKIGDPNSPTLEHLHISRKGAVNVEDYKNKKSDMISIVSDVVFKVMIQNSKRLKYSAKLISYFVDVDYEELLNNIELLSNEYDRNNIHSKSERGDFVADIGKFKTLIEVNNYNTTDDADNILERDLEYAFKVYGSNNTIGKKYDYKHVILINLNNFYFEELDGWNQEFTLNDNNGILLTDKITIINIYLPKLLNLCYTMNKEELENVEKYLLTLYSGDYNMVKKMSEGDNVMEDYVREAKKVEVDNSVMEAYDKEAANRYGALIEGRAEGLAEGREKGLVEGEKKAHIEDAKKMLSENLDIELISRITNLSFSEIESLKEE